MRHLLVKPADSTKCYARCGAIQQDPDDWGFLARHPAHVDCPDCQQLYAEDSAAMGDPLGEIREVAGFDWRLTIGRRGASGGEEYAHELFASREEAEAAWRDFTMRTPGQDYTSALVEQRVSGGWSAGTAPGVYTA